MFPVPREKGERRKKKGGVFREKVGAVLPRYPFSGSCREPIARLKKAKPGRGRGSVPAAA